MTDESSGEQVTVIVDRALVFLSRGEVVEQLVVLLLVLIVSRIMSRALWWTIDLGRKRLPSSARLARLLETGVSSRLLDLVRAGSAPTIGIVLATVTKRELEAAGRVTGLLEELIGVFVVLLAGEIVMTGLTGGLEPAEGRRHRRRFFKPLIAIIVGLMILNHLADLGRLASAPAVEAFGSPLSVGALFVATLGIWFWTDAINLMNTVVVDFVSKHTSFNDGSAEATLLLVRYGLILMGITYGVGQLQLDASTVAAITGGLSVGIGFGMREVLGNFISGSFLLFERSLRPGDIVEMDEQIGTVERLTVRSTTVRTIDNEEIVVPNQRFFTQSFKTFTGTDEKVRFNVVVMANCDNDVEHVRGVLHRVASSHPEILDDPRPDAWVEDGFGNNIVSYRLNMWSASPLAIPRLRSDVVRLVWIAFQDAGIALVFPDMKVHSNASAGEHLWSPSITPHSSTDGANASAPQSNPQDLQVSRATS